MKSRSKYVNRTKLYRDKVKELKAKNDRVIAFCETCIGRAHSGTAKTNYKAIIKILTYEKL